LSGCGANNGPKRNTIHGKVTVNDAPLKDGTIIFAPTDGNTGPSTGGKIIDGEYRIQSKEGPVLGPHRIEVTARKPKDGSVPSSPDPQAPFSLNAKTTPLIQFIPEQYNKKSTLTHNVQSGENTYDIQIVISEKR